LRKHRIQWIKTWFSQCILTTSQSYFSQYVEKAIETSTLNEFNEKCNDYIDELVENIKKKQNKLDKLKLSPLIVLGVHERSVVNKLINSKIRNIFEFEWISQLRTYVEDDNIFVRCMQTNYP